MGRVRGKLPSPAMGVAIVALVFAVAGSAIAGVATISVLSKKEKKQTRNIAKDEINKAAPGLSVANATNAQNATNAGQLGGLPAASFATRLFAYIRDTGAASAATLEYGSGVTAVSDADGPSSYTVTFNRSLVNCVAQAVPGVGDPLGGDAATAASMPEVRVSSGEANDFLVTFRNPSFSTVDTSFMIAAFC